MGGARSSDRGGNSRIQGSCGKPKGKSPLWNPGVDGKVILRCIFNKYDFGVWTGLGCVRIGIDGGHL
jgi:hypothetical protein